MADLLGILWDFINYGFQIKAALDEAGYNSERCGWIEDLLGTLAAVAKSLEGEGGETMRGAAAGLEEAHQRAARLVARCRRKGILRGMLDAKGIADELAWLCRQLHLNLTATSASMLVGIRADVSKLVGLRADFARIMERLQVHPHQSNQRTGGNSIDEIRHLRSTSIIRVLWIKPHNKFLCFPRVRNKGQIVCPVTICNRQDRIVGVSMARTNKQFTCPKARRILMPHSALAVPVTMWKQKQRTGDKDEFSMLLIVPQSRDDLADFLDSKSDIMAQAMKRQRDVYRELLEATFEKPKYQIMRRSTEDAFVITSTSVHPWKAWVVTGYQEGWVCIWDYQKKQEEETAAMVWHQVSKKLGVCVVKFVAGDWLVVGAEGGYIYVYHYDHSNAELSLEEKLIAHSRDPVNLLAVHETETYVVSSSKGCDTVDLWDWKNGWTNIKSQKFYVNSDGGIHNLKFRKRPTENSTICFYVKLVDDSAQVWSITGSSAKVTTVHLPYRTRRDYFTSYNQRYMVSCDTDTGVVIVVRVAPKSESDSRRQYSYTLAVEGHQTTKVACHPNHPILATTLDDGTVCLWDARDTRLKEMVHITDSTPQSLKFCTDMNGLTRLLVKFPSMMAIVEVDMEMENTGGSN